MRKLLVTLVVLAAVLGLGLAAFISVVWGRLHEPHPPAAAEVFVDIPAGTSSREIGRRLVGGGVVRDEFAFRAALWWSGRSRALQAGEYRFAEPLSVLAVIERLAQGDVHFRRITFPEGLTIAEMAAIYETRGFGAAPDFVRAAGDVSMVAALDPAATTLEGYLFPETYAVPRNTPASTLVSMMVARFQDVYDEGLRAQAAEQQLTTREVVTLAGLIEKETGHGEERFIVAAVYRNRLRIGMPLQADPTVIYALQQAGGYDGNIRKADLSFDSPYNTYRYPGLPPGPIASPGRAALDAALNPADAPYLYFVSRNDGTHVFARTLREHNANVRQYQVLYFREQRRRQREAEASAAETGVQGNGANTPVGSAPTADR